MLRIIPVLVLAVVIGVMSSFNTLAEDSLGVSEFRKLYDSLLSGKTLVNESQQDGVVVKKEKIYGKAVDTGDGDFDIPVSQVITYTQDGEMEWKVQVNIIDRVNDLGGRAIIQEEITGISVLEQGDEKPEESNG
ncbi:MAG: hypothetical protein O6759_04590, partial [Candidatus Dadabacteria bacterium]|nr:hypothetical protein [Candidatus Dadabacteria bacterium]